MSNEERQQPARIKNLAELKRLIKPDTELKATMHSKHPEIVGLTREVIHVQTNGYYSVIKDQPDHQLSRCNYGKGFWSPFEKASCYEFDGSTVRVLDARAKDGSTQYEMVVYNRDNSMSETNEAEPVESDEPVLGM